MLEKAEEGVTSTFQGLKRSGILEEPVELRAPSQV